MKHLIISIVIAFFVLSFLGKLKPAVAIYDPTSVPNNRFGVHIADINDIKEAGQIVNSNGGEWGYITFVIQKGERDTQRWQTVMDEMRRLHLIPIVRIASAPIPGRDYVWEKPSPDEIDGWVSFLNSLNWVIKNRYVIIGNEPNQAKEWGGEINPKEYADYLKIFSQKLKNSNEDFYIMPAGFDAQAPNSKDTMDEALYLQKMLEEDPKVFDYVDGWASHSYPNPNFSGSPQSSGKGSVRTFEWELNYLKFLGVNKKMPVFITETGWVHSPANDDSKEIGQKFEDAFNNAWNNNQVIAVTPFVYKYISPPFDVFSWVDKDQKPYGFVQNILNLPKQKGKPIQDSKGDILTEIIPTLAISGSQYHALLFVKNVGQSIWSKDSLKAIDNLGNKPQITSIFPQNPEPNQIAVILVTGNFPSGSGSNSYSITLALDGKTITNPFSTNVNLIPPFPNLSEIIDYLKITIARKLKSI